MKLIKKGISTEKLNKFEVLRKDPQLEILFREDLNIDFKIETIRQKIDILLVRKTSSWANWEPDDKLYFYHSLNRQLHNQIKVLKAYLDPSDQISKLYPDSSLRSRNKSKSVSFYYTG